ncbi:PQQ-like beta-propeller repeat protein [bacterium]|nr:PQQ-like beta-propeller repeat protein [bacterium]
MKKKLMLICLFASVSICAGNQNNKSNQYWPSWRGPLNTGEAVNANPPVQWSETENIKWKIDIPGKGLSSPIVWEDQIIITTALALDEVADKDRINDQSSGPFWMKLMRWSKTTKNVLQYTVYSISRDDGHIIWRTPVREDLPHEGIHKDASWASNSCVTDGEHIIASFGSAGIYCLNMSGEVLWEKDFGDMHIKNTFGEGISPVLHNGKVVIAWDHEGVSFITVLNKNTGHTIWKHQRDEHTNWSTPIVVEVSGRPQIIRSGAKRCISYDLETGKEIWSTFGVSKSACPTPVYGNGIVYLTGSYRGGSLQAIKLDGATGRLDSTDQILWTHYKEIPYIPSPLLYEDKIYFFKDYTPKLSCLDAVTGEVFYTRQKLDEMKNIYASPIAAGGRVYAAGRNGVVYVMAPGEKYELIAINRLDDIFDASPVAVENDLILRGVDSLYLISSE